MWFFFFCMTALIFSYTGSLFKSVAEEKVFVFNVQVA